MNALLYRSMAPIRTTPLLTILVLLGLALSSAQGADHEMAKRNFYTSCAQCHGETGKGDGIVAKKFRLKIMDFTDKEQMAKITDQTMIQIIKLGGKAVGRNPQMPPFEGKLSEEEMTDIIAYIRTLSR